MGGLTPKSVNALFFGIYKLMLNIYFVVWVEVSM